MGAKFGFLQRMRYSACLSEKAGGTQTACLYVWRGGVRGGGGGCWGTDPGSIRNPSCGLAVPSRHCVSRDRALSLLGPTFVKGGQGVGLL